MLFLSTEEIYTNEAIKNTSCAELELEVEDSIAGFLGVHINQNYKNGPIKLTYTGLVKGIEDLDIGHLPHMFNP